VEEQMKLSFKILESDSYIRQQILIQIKNHMDQVFNKSLSSIKSQIKPIIEDALKQEPEYLSLMSGQLRLEFGIPDVSKVDDVISKLADTIFITKNPINITNKGLSGGFTIYGLKADDFNGVIADESALVVDSKGGYSLPWLEWLLLKGNKTIIQKHEVQIGPNTNSRTGMAIMVDSKKSWRVPPEFVGNTNNNWTTRAIERCQNAINQVIKKEIEANT
jgi:hypothetical protein